ASQRQRCLELLTWGGVRSCSSASPLLLVCPGARRCVPSFPTRRSSDLGGRAPDLPVRRPPPPAPGRRAAGHRPGPPPSGRQPHQDRKSTRLNSSHDQISYAVSCLKKKKIKQWTTNTAPA